MIENRLVGIKSREIYEAPALLVLIQAHRDLESLTLTADVSQYKRGIEETYARLVYNGLWYSPLKQALDALFKKPRSASLAPCGCSSLKVTPPLSVANPPTPSTVPIWPPTEPRISLIIKPPKVSSISGACRPASGPSNSAIPEAPKPGHLRYSGGKPLCCFFNPAAFPEQLCPMPRLQTSRSSPIRL